MVSEFEPRWTPRKTAIQQQILIFGEDVNAGIDAFQKVVMRYRAATKKVVRRSEKWSLASSTGYHLGENDYIFDVVQIYFFESK